MSNAKQQWLVTGHGVVESHAQLWQLCEQCKELLGSGGTAIAEDATRVAIEPWPSLPRQPWTRGRLFGSTGELQWRSYRGLVRVALLVDVADGVQGQEVASRLRDEWDLTPGELAELRVESGNVALQTTNNLTSAETRTYGTEDEPGLFVRYVGVR